MKYASTQPSRRKNPDSQREHGLQLSPNSSFVDASENSHCDPRRSLSPSLEASAFELPSNENTGPLGRTRTEHDDQLLTVREVADLLQVPVSWVYEHTRPHSANRLPHLKVGKYIRFLYHDIVSHLKTQRTAQRLR
jgi:excisionase family DNA binding protein